MSLHLEAFAPHQALAAELLPYVEMNNDGSHDVTHLARVWKNVRAISATEGGDPEILAAAVLLHDCVQVDKNSPLRASASRLAADKAREILGARRWTIERIGHVAHAIEAHSFSARIAPRTVEAKVLQDADRLDAIGFIGVARCFYVAGRLGAALYDPRDPAASRRPLDDARFALDHFRAKLLRLAASFQTRTGAELAVDRTRRITLFLSGFEEEI